MAYTFLSHAAILLRLMGSYHNTHGEPKIYPGLLHHAELCPRRTVMFHLLWTYIETTNITKIISWEFTASSHWHSCFKMKNSEQVLKSCDCS